MKKCMKCGAEGVPSYDELVELIKDAHTELGEFLIGYQIEDDADHAPRALHNRLWAVIQRIEKKGGEIALIEEAILKEWERAGGIYSLAARLVREDLEKEKGEAATSPGPQTTQGKEA